MQRRSAVSGKHSRSETGGRFAKLPAVNPTTAPRSSQLTARQGWIDGRVQVSLVFAPDTFSSASNATNSQTFWPIGNPSLIYSFLSFALNG